MASHSSETAQPVETSAGYEQTDIKISAIFITMILMVITTVISLILMIWMLNAMRDAKVTVLKTAPSSMALDGQAVADEGTAAIPLLQSDPKADLDLFKIHEEAVIHHYGWVDRDHGIAHIPIEEAMKQIVENGVPVWEPTAAEH